MLSNKCHILASIKNIIDTLLQVTIKTIYCLYYWFGNIFDQSEKVSDYIQFDLTIVFIKSNSRIELLLYYITCLFISVLISSSLHQSREPSQNSESNMAQRPHIASLKRQNIILLVLFLKGVRRYVVIYNLTIYYVFTQI